MSIKCKCKAFSAVLTPYRSMSGRGFTILICTVAAISLCVGGFFASLGAWPVAGFFGLNVFALYRAFKLNNRDERLAEYIRLDEKILYVRRITPSGRTIVWKFNPYWARIRTEYDEFGCTRLALTSHGNTLVIGAFLGRGARSRFASAFQTALATHHP